MKTIIIITILMACLNSVFSNGEISKELENNIKIISNAWNQEKGFESIDEKTLKSIRAELYANRIAMWNLPPAVRNEISDVIEPLREFSLNLSNSPKSSHRYYAASFLGYMKQNELTKNALLRLAREQNSSTAGTSMDIIFGMGWDNDELRQELVADLIRFSKGEKTKTIAFTNVGKWGVKESIPVIIDILDKTYFENSIKGKGIVRQLRFFGQDGVSALPILEKILKKLQSDKNADFRDLEAIQLTIKAIKEGGIRFKNSKNEKEGRSSDLDLVDAQETQTAKTQEREPKPLTEKSSTKADKPASFPWWLLGIVGLIVVLGFLLLKGKSK